MKGSSLKLLRLELGPSELGVLAAVISSTRFLEIPLRERFSLSCSCRRVYEHIPHVKPM